MSKHRKTGEIKAKQVPSSKWNEAEALAGVLFEQHGKREMCVYVCVSTIRQAMAETIRFLPVRAPNREPTLFTSAKEITFTIFTFTPLLPQIHPYWDSKQTSPGVPHALAISGMHQHK